MIQQENSRSVVKRWLTLVWCLLLLSCAGCVALAERDYSCIPSAACSAQGKARNTDGRPRPIVGAIRWDAWYGSKDPVGQAVEQSLGHQRWHNRLPFFAQPVSENKVRFPGYSQEILDKEIAYAHQAGLDYWAFLLYPSGSAMTDAFNFYLTSSYKAGIHFCLILSGQMLGQLRWEFEAPQERAKEINRIIDILRQPMYQKVMGNRPLLYLGPSIQDRWIKEFGGTAGVRKLVDNLRDALQREGVSNPYFVAMISNPEQHGKMLVRMGQVDAITSYAVQCGGQGAPFVKLAQCAEKFWDRCRVAGGKVVPLVMTGWDRRPRVEHPVPWEKFQQPGIGMERFYQSPAPSDLVEHLKQAFIWVNEHPRVADAKAVLIYAWNENDEGGWLVPTLLEGNIRLKAIGRLLNRDAQH